MAVNTSSFPRPVKGLKTQDFAASTLNAARLLYQTWIDAAAAAGLDRSILDVQVASDGSEYVLLVHYTD